MSQDVCIGIVGVGQIGTIHVQRYEKIGGVKIVAIADVNENRARQVAEKHGIQHVHADFRELLARDDLQAVDVCLHNNLHAPVTIAALEAGKDVFCEKPMAGAYADARAMYETAQRTGRKLSIQLYDLFHAETRAAKRIIDEGRLGRIYYAKSYGYRRRGRAYVDGYGSKDFSRKATAGGGALYDMGVYHVAQVLYLLGNPAMLTATGATHQEVPMYEDRREACGFEVEELGLGFVRLAGGITFVIEESWAIHMDGGDSSRIAGAQGGLKLKPLTYYSTIADIEMNATFELDQADHRWHDCFSETAYYDGPQNHWVAALRGDVPLLPTAEIALNTMKISEGIYRSTRLGREVTAEEIERESASTALAP